MEAKHGGQFEYGEYGGGTIWGREDLEMSGHGYDCPGHIWTCGHAAYLDVWMSEHLDMEGE